MSGTPVTGMVLAGGDTHDVRQGSRGTWASTLNSAKQARGPQEWRRLKNRCAYVGEWVAVKIRWGLKVDSKEKAALTMTAAACPNVKVTVKKASPEECLRGRSRRVRSRWVEIG